MSELQSALVKASRALDAHFRLADDVKPLRDAIGESLDIEKVLVAQRAEKGALDADCVALGGEKNKLTTERDALLADIRQAKEGRAAAVQEAEAEAAVIRLNVDRWATDAQAEIESKRAEVDAVLASARGEADGIISDAKARAAKIAAGKTEEIEGLDSTIRSRRKELAAVQSDIIGAQDKLAVIQREIDAVKARLG